MTSYNILISGQLGGTRDRRLPYKERPPLPWAWRDQAEILGNNCFRASGRLACLASLHENDSAPRTND